MKFFKSLYQVLLFVPIIFSAQTKTTISILNNSEFDRKEAIASIKWETIVLYYPQIDTTEFVLINSKTKKQVPFQMEYQGHKTIQNLLVQVDVNAKSKVILLIKKENLKLLSQKRMLVLFQNARMILLGKMIKLLFEPTAKP